MAFAKYGFQGRESDTESGLQYFRARSYDPMTGRFTSRDPVPHPNLYLFVDNDPTNKVDPHGLEASASCWNAVDAEIRKVKAAQTYDAWVEAKARAQAVIDQYMAYYSGETWGGRLEDHLAAKIFNSDSAARADLGRMQARLNGVSAPAPCLSSTASQDWSPLTNGEKEVRAIEEEHRRQDRNIGNTWVHADKIAWGVADWYIDNGVQAPGWMLGMITVRLAMRSARFAEGFADWSNTKRDGLFDAQGGRIGVGASHVDDPGSGGRNFFNQVGTRYPQVTDLKTGGLISFPTGNLQRVAKDARVAWTNKERGEFIAEWYTRGYSTPAGGWDKYDIHHIRPREYGGTNAFENLTPILRETHQEEFNSWWYDFGR